MPRVLPFALFLALVAGCAPLAAPTPRPGTIGVLGTENFYADLLARVGGSHVTASSLLNDPNADPHEFEASPLAASLVADARLVIVNGMGYDDFMPKLLGASPRADRVVISVQDLLGLPDDVNAHVWYDPGTMAKVADAAAAALARLEPGAAADFEAARSAYVASLAPIGAKVASLRSAYAGTRVACTEPVAEYLTDAIGLVVLTPVSFQQAIEAGTDPSPLDVADERDLLTGRRVKALLYNSQVTTPLTRGIRELAAANAIPVVGVAETMPADRAGYAAWMLAEIADLEAALGR